VDSSLGSVDANISLSVNDCTLTEETLNLMVQDIMNETGSNAVSVTADQSQCTTSSFLAAASASTHRARAASAANRLNISHARRSHRMREKTAFTQKQRIRGTTGQSILLAISIGNLDDPERVKIGLENSFHTGSSNQYFEWMDHAVQSVSLVNLVEKLGTDQDDKEEDLNYDMFELLLSQQQEPKQQEYATIRFGGDLLEFNGITEEAMLKISIELSSVLVREVDSSFQNLSCSDVTSGFECQVSSSNAVSTINRLNNTLSLLANTSMVSRIERTFGAKLLYFWVSRRPNQQEGDASVWKMVAGELPRPPYKLTVVTQVRAPCPFARSLSKFSTSLEVAVAAQLGDNFSKVGCHVYHCEETVVTIGCDEQYFKMSQVVSNIGSLNKTLAELAAGPFAKTIGYLLGGEFIDWWVDLGDTIPAPQISRISPTPSPLVSPVIEAPVPQEFLPPPVQPVQPLQPWYVAPESAYGYPTLPTVFGGPIQEVGVPRESLSQTAGWGPENLDNFVPFVDITPRNEAQHLQNRFWDQGGMIFPSEGGMDNDVGYSFQPQTPFLNPFSFRSKRDGNGRSGGPSFDSGYRHPDHSKLAAFGHRSWNVQDIEQQLVDMASPKTSAEVFHDQLLSRRPIKWEFARHRRKKRGLLK